MGSFGRYEAALWPSAGTLVMGSSPAKEAQLLKQRRRGQMWTSGVRAGQKGWSESHMVPAAEGLRGLLRPLGDGDGGR